MSLMRCWTQTVLLLLCATPACGDDDGDGGVPDAGAPDASAPDAGGPDATPAPVGAWRLVEFQEPASGGGTRTIGTTDTPVTDPATGATRQHRVNGHVTLTADGELGGVFTRVIDGRLADDNGSGTITRYTIASDLATIDLGTGDPFTLAWDRDASPPTLRFGLPSGHAWTFERYEPPTIEMIALRGAVTVADDGAPGGFVPIAAPRVGLVYLLRKMDGTIGTIQVPGGDVPLSGFGATPAQSTTFDLSRTEPALGVERIVFGEAFASIGLVVVYDDVNLNGQLDQLFGSCDPGEDCVRGVSDVILGYRFGTSPELDASPYRFLTPGWSWARLGRDLRQTPERRGLVSHDVTTAAPLPADVVVPENPEDVVLPPLQL